MPYHDCDVPRHFESKHNDVWSAVNKLRSTANDANIKNVWEEIKEHIADAILEIKEKQSTITFRRFRPSSYEKLPKTVAWLFFMISKGVPRENFDDRLFQFSLSVTNGCCDGSGCSKCSIFSSTYSSELILPIQRALQILMVQYLKSNGVSSVSSTADCWKSKGAPEKYLAITGHYMDANFMPSSFLMGFEYLPFSLATTKCLKRTTNSIVSKFFWWRREGIFSYFQYHF